MALAGVVLALPDVGLAEQAAATAPTTVRGRLEAVEARIEELSAGLDSTVTPGLSQTSQGLADLTRQVSELRAAVEALRGELTRATEDRAGLDQRLAEQRRRIEELEAEAERRTEEDAEARANPIVSYSAADGLVIRPIDQGLVLGVRGNLWARYEGGAVESPAGTRWLSTFSAPELRFDLSASLGSGLVRLFAQPALEFGRPALQEGYAELNLHALARLRVGQIQVPFDWESNEAPELLPFAGPSRLAQVFGRTEDTGVLLLGALPGEAFSYQVGVFNGSGREAENDNYDMLIAFLLRYRPFGPQVAGWSDLSRSRTPSLVIGLGFAYDLEDIEAQDGSGRHYNEAVYQLTADAILRWRGASLSGAFHYRARDPGAAGSVVNSYGYSVQAGYVAWTEHLEIVARYLAIDPDMEGVDDHGREVSAGITFFLRGEQVKLTALYSYAWQTPDLDLETTAHTARVQAQGSF